MCDIKKRGMITKLIIDSIRLFQLLVANQTTLFRNIHDVKIPVIPDNSHIDHFSFTWSLILVGPITWDISFIQVLIWTLFVSISASIKSVRKY